MQLTYENSTASPLVDYTDRNGAYSFTDLDPGKYSISMISPAQAAQDDGTYRATYAKDNTVVNVGTNGKVGVNTYTSVSLDTGESGKNFNFAEVYYPTALLSKRILMGDDPGVHHTPDIIKPVPEPSSFVLLAIAGLLGAGFVGRSKRSAA